MKERILRELRQGLRVSGEELGRNLGISRAAVWKYIRELREQGYVINSSPNKGYLLEASPDIPIPEEVLEGLSTHVLGRTVIYRSKVASTQDIAKSLASEGGEEGTMVIAEAQTKGRGRMGRTWVSNPGGLYFSLILRPEIEPSEALKLPLIMGVGIAQAINNVTGLNPRLKWPNDIMVAGKKVGGILSEMSAETDRVQYVVVGVGLNLNSRKEDFSQELQDTAVSLMEAAGEYVSRVRLIQMILYELEELYEVYKTSGFESIRYRWKAFSNTIGRKVWVSSGTEQMEGEALDIDQDGALILRKPDGTDQRIVAGDVSLREDLP